MPSVDEDLVEGLRITDTERGLVLTRKFHCKDMTGATSIDVIAMALTLTATGTSHTGANIPEKWESLTAGGHTFYCKERDAEPWPPADALVTCIYDTDLPPIAGFGPTQIEVGATLEQSETDFDYSNLVKPFASRSPITVDPPTTPAGDAQAARVPILVPKACIILTRQESSSPEPRADGWVGFTNSDNWRGYPPNTALFLEIYGRNAGDGIWETTYRAARDPLGKFQQVARWVNPDGTFPNLTAADVAGNKGIKLVTVQGSKPFAPLAL